MVSRLSAPADLAPLFEAQSVALIGASERSAYSIAVERNLRRMGFDLARFYPVNPTRDEVFGLRSYPSIRHVPEAVDLAVLATSTGTVPSLVRQCAEAGVRSAVVLADGFAESGTPEGRAMQVEIAETARSAGIRLVGPNCMGVVVPHRGLGTWAGDIPANLRAGNVGAVFQSSGTLNLVLLLAGSRHLGLRLAVSSGNQAVLTLGDYLWYAVNDPGVQVVATFMEAIVEPASVLAALDCAVELGKPVVALRVGRSERGQRNALAHTGSLAGGGVAWDTLLRQKGVVLVEDLDELIEAAVLFSELRPDPSAPGDGVGLVTISGGDCTLLCDLSERERVRLPDLSRASRDEIVARLEKPTVLGNPLDIENLQRQDEDAFFQCLDTLIAERAFSLIGVRLNFPTAVTPSMRKAYTHVAEEARRQGKRLVFLTRASEPLADEWHEFFDELGVPLLKEYRKGLRTIRRFFEYEAFLARRDASDATDSLRLGVNVTALRDLVQRSGHRVLTFADTQRLLDAYGIPTAPAALVGSAADARAGACRIGFPVAVKIASVDIPHKSDAGALVLGLDTEDAVEEAYERVVAAARAAAPDGEVEGVVVQRMVQGVAETIVGVSYDRQVGPLVMFGLGGVFVEIMQDVAFRVGRLSTGEAQRLISDVRGAALLRGARGRPRGDERALADALVRVSALAADLQGVLAELDLNPLLVLPEGEGVMAVDALLVRAEATD